MLQITDEMRDGRVYNGSSAVFGAVIGGNNYLVKPSRVNTISAFTEYIASNFISALGVPCQLTRLGYYNGAYAAVIKNMILDSSLFLHPFVYTEQAYDDTEQEPHEYTLIDIQKCIKTYPRMPKDCKKETLNLFWDMFICDAILGNSDRHGGNWGFLADNTHNLFVPIYDNDHSLFPNIPQVISFYTDTSSRKLFLQERVFNSPTSSIKVKHGGMLCRLNYYEVCSDLRISRVFAERIRYFRDTFTAHNIFDIMHNIVKDLPLADEYKQFFIEIATLRYMCIIQRRNFEKSYKSVEGWLAYVK